MYAHLGADAVITLISTWLGSQMRSPIASIRGLVDRKAFAATSHAARPAVATSPSPSLPPAALPLVSSCYSLSPPVSPVPPLILLPRAELIPSSTYQFLVTHT